MDTGLIKMKRHLATIGLVFFVTLLTWQFGLMPAQGGNVNPSGGGGGSGCAPSTWAALPGSPSVGACFFVTNAASCTAGTAVTTSGSTPCQLTWSGSNWVPAGNAVSASSGGLNAATGGLTASAGTVSVDAPLAVIYGGTAATSAGSTAAHNIGAAAEGANSDITSLTGLTTPLSVAQGGSGSGTAAGARTNLGLGSMATVNSPVPVANGGTNATSAGATAANNIGAAAKGANSDITSLSGLTTPLSVAQGGTAGTTQATARTGIGAAASGANSDITALSALSTPITAAQGGMPSDVTGGNFPQADGSTWNSVAMSGDMNLDSSGGGVAKVIGFNGVPLSGSWTASTAGQIWVSNASNQAIKGTVALDPNTTIGQIPAVSAAGNPNTYSAVTPGAQGTLMTSNGATSLPTYQKNNAPVLLAFNIDGTINTSTTISRVCPVTMSVAPGFVTSYPYLKSQAAIGTPDTAATDAYTIIDVTNSNTQVGTLTLAQTTGAPTFATTACSSSFDGTQGSTAWARTTSATTQAVTVPANATAGDGAVLSCFIANGTGSFSPPSNWSAITGGSTQGGSQTFTMYEKILVGGDLGQPVTCSFSGTAAAINAAVYTVKNVPNGEIVDKISVAHSSSTSCATTTITPTNNGELILQGCSTGGNTTVTSWSPANTNVATSASGTGAQYLVQGTAGATGTATGTLGSSGGWGGFQIAFLNSATSCTLCTAGDRMTLTTPSSGTLGSNLSVAINGAQ